MLTLCGDTLGFWWDQTWTKCLSQSIKTYISMLALWSMEIIDRNRLKWKVNEENAHSHSQQIKSNNFTVSLWVKRWEKLNQSQLPLRLASCEMNCICFLYYHCIFHSSIWSRQGFEILSLHVFQQLAFSQLTMWTNPKSNCWVSVIYNLSFVKYKLHNSCHIDFVISK